MSLRQTLLATLTITALALPQASFAYVTAEIDLGIAPPHARTEMIPAPRPGVVWAPGFWAWDGYHHVWVPGHWMEERPGFVWVQDAWISRGPNWHYVPGHWAQDHTDRIMVDRNVPYHYRHNY